MLNSTLAYGLNYIANEQLKKVLNDLKNSDDDLYNTVSYPLIYAKSDPLNVKTTSPYVVVSPVGTSGTMITSGRFSDLNKDKTVKKKITKYFLYKILDKWLYQEFRPILAFVKISDGKPSLIRSMSDYKPDSLSSDSVENIEKRIDYLSHILINKQLVKHILKKIINENNIDWIQLNKHKSMIKKVLRKYINSKLEDAVKSAEYSN